MSLYKKMAQTAACVCWDEGECYLGRRLRGENNQEAIISGYPLPAAFNIAA